MTPVSYLGYIEWTQSAVDAKAMKKSGDLIHDAFLLRKREEKRRKADMVRTLNKKQRREDVEEEEEEQEEEDKKEALEVKKEQDMLTEVKSENLLPKEDVKNKNEEEKKEDMPIKDKKRGMLKEKENKLTEDRNEDMGVEESKGHLLTSESASAIEDMAVLKEATSEDKVLESKENLAEMVDRDSNLKENRDSALVLNDCVKNGVGKVASFDGGVKAVAEELIIR